MTRQAGSGLANTTADAVEFALAAILVGDELTIQDQQRRLEHEYAIGRCDIAPATLVEWIREAVSALPFEAHEAVHQPGDRLGDVGLVDRSGEPWWIEVKAQTKKASFSEITQSDWIRDVSDAGSWLTVMDPAFGGLLPEDLMDDLCPTWLPDDYFDGWDFASLVIADIALLPDRDRRHRAGVQSPADLRAFLDHKYLMHLTQEGLRLCRFDRLVPVAAWLAGDSLNFALKDTNRGNVVSVPVSCPGPVVRGSIHFTYHYGYTGAVGRHKLHAVSVDSRLCDLVTR